jgi:peroxiredoxin
MQRFALVCLLLLVAVAASAQTDPRTNAGGIPSNMPVPRVGGAGETQRFIGHVTVGERAPDFELIAPGGAQYHLKQARGHWVALFFTDRREDLAQLALFAATLDSLHFTSLVACHEQAQTLATWQGAKHAPLTALADERGEIAAAYGLWDNEGAKTRPGLFLLDPYGVVKVALLGQKVGAPSLAGLVQTATGGF